MPREIRRDEVRGQIDRGVQLVEVLPAKEYRQDHLPGASARNFSSSRGGDRVDRYLAQMGRGSERRPTRLRDPGGELLVV
jgi:hypothetical protein